MLVKLELGNSIESRLIAEAKSRRGISIDRIVEEIVTNHYLSQIKLSATITYDSFNGYIYDTGIDKRVKLTNKENSLLNLLVINKNVVVATEFIYSYVWNSNKEFEKEDFKFTLRNIILKLRRKLGNTVNIRNKSGVGYILDTDK